MNILFCGLTYDRAKEKEHIQLSKIGLPSAMNKFQWNLIDGLIENQCDIEILNGVPFGTWPTAYRKLTLRNQVWMYKASLCRDIGSINLPVLKQATRCLAYYRSITKWAESPLDDHTVITYSLYLPALLALYLAKKHISNLKVCLIAADLPCHFGILPKSKFKKFIYICYGKLSLKLTKSIDSFVLLTEQMKDPLKLEDRPYIVLEGIATNNSGRSIINTYGNGKKIILYTGTLHYQFGIKDLLEAFEKIGGLEYELWLAGSGEATDEIKLRAKQDGRIKYFGYIDNEAITKLQSQATILINPRKNEGEYTKYSFPSKTIEYMVSGVPVLMHKLSGIPDVYDEFLLYIKGSTANELAISIEDACNISPDDLESFGLAAREFVLSHKNAREAARRVLNMLNI